MDNKRRISFIRDKKNLFIRRDEPLSLTAPFNKNPNLPHSCIDSTIEYLNNFPWEFNISSAAVDDTIKTSIFFLSLACLPIYPFGVHASCVTSLSRRHRSTPQQIAVAANNRYAYQKRVCGERSHSAMLNSPFFSGFRCRTRLNFNRLNFLKYQSRFSYANFQFFGTLRSSSS